MNDPDLDAEFARIIAGWDSEAPDPSPTAAAGKSPASSDQPDSPSETPAEPQPGDSPELTADQGTPPPSPDQGTSQPSPDQGPPPTADQATPPPTADQGSPPPTGTALGGPEPDRPQASPAARTDGAGSGSAERGLIGLPIAPTTAHVWRGAEPPREDVDDLLESVDPTDEHFVPPTDPDLPTAEDDPMFWAIVVGLAGGPLLLLYVLLFDRDGSSWWIITALTMIVVGFVLLVLRGGTERDPSDDGTRV